MTSAHCCPKTRTQLAFTFAGGELFGLIRKTRRFPENDARYFFQQLICGIEYLHEAGVNHRDIKLENTLIGGNKPSTLVKICDFGYSKRPEVEQSQCKSVVGTPAYLAPEVLASKPYKGAAVDVWSCGVLLYVMLVGAYPFGGGDPSYLYVALVGVLFSFPSCTCRASQCRSADHQHRFMSSCCLLVARLQPAAWRLCMNSTLSAPFLACRSDFQKIVAKIMALDYTIPEKLQLSEAVKDLIARIFVKEPEKRITIDEIKQHEWYKHRLPYELCEGYKGFERCGAKLRGHVRLLAGRALSKGPLLSSECRRADIQRARKASRRSRIC